MDPFPLRSVVAVVVVVVVLWCDRQTVLGGVKQSY